VRNLAVDGRSGRKMRAAIPVAIENAPKMRKTYIHLGSPVVMCPTAYPINLFFQGQVFTYIYISSP
jgi:hypothetical protein